MTKTILRLNYFQHVYNFCLLLFLKDIGKALWKVILLR